MDSRTSFISQNINTPPPLFNGNGNGSSSSQLPPMMMGSFYPNPGLHPIPMPFPLPPPPPLSMNPTMMDPRPFLPLGMIPPPPPMAAMTAIAPPQQQPQSIQRTSSFHQGRSRARSASSQRRVSSLSTESSPSSSPRQREDDGFINNSTLPPINVVTTTTTNMSSPSRRHTRPSSPIPPPSTRASSSHSRPQSGTRSTHSCPSSPSASSHRRGQSMSKSSHIHASPTPSLQGNTAVLSESDTIKVAVRVRPLNAIELDRGDLCTIAVDPHSTGQVHVTVPASTPSLSSPRVSSPHASAMSAAVTRSFPFHACLGPEASQADVMKLCGITQLLDAALDGYNATIFAYGQTGSGKTYTINGSDDCYEENSSPYNTSQDTEDDGIVPRSLAYIFSHVHARNEAFKNPSLLIDTPPQSTAMVSDGCIYSVKLSYCEIYNEAVYDLLNFDHTRQLAIRWDPVRGFHAPELHIEDCSSLDDAKACISCGLGHRRVGSHNLNLESSRSHSLLTVYINAIPQRPEAPDYGTPRMSKVVFVDLAGSERLKDSQSTGDAMKETANINRSLFMLGKVISALSSGAKGALVPYRESKLTKLLMDSLGGTALSLMIACCSPSAVHVEETLSTLSYATRAKNIRNLPIVQVDPREAATAALRREIKLLRTENAYLREQLMLANQSRDTITIDNTSAAASPTTNQPDKNHSPIPSPLPAHSILLPLPSSSSTASTIDQNALVKQLADAQSLLSTLSSENARLAGENERLRAGGLQVSSDYCGAVEEIEWLRGKLAKLEATLVGIPLHSNANNDSIAIVGGGGGDESRVVGGLTEITHTPSIAKTTNELNSIDSSMKLIVSKEIAALNTLQQQDENSTAVAGVIDGSTVLKSDDVSRVEEE